MPRRHKAGLAAAFAISLGLKFALYRPDTIVAQQVRQATARDQASDVLEAAGLDTTIDPAEPGTVSGSRGDCTATVMVISPEGWQAAMITRLAPPAGRVTFVYRHERFAQQPAWRTWFDDHRNRLVRYTGEDARSDPVFGVVETPACLPLAIAWERLGGGLGGGS